MQKTMCCAPRDVSPILQHLGVFLGEVKDGHAVLELPITPILGQGAGLVAGGVIATIADECMAHAVSSKEKRNAVTLEMNIRFLRAARIDTNSRLIAKAHVVKWGNTIITTEANVRDEQERLLATAGASFYITG